MADYVRYRMAAARIGATMAVIGLLSNLSDRIASAHASGKSAHAAAVKGHDSLSSIEHKLSSNYLTSKKIDTTFLKIKSADSSFLKIKSANTDFLKIDTAATDYLKIDDAATEFLKIDDANASFLKIDDANAEFLKVGSTAANSSELGGLKPDAFVQGAGSVVSGAAQVGPNNSSFNPVALISSPDGLLRVSVYEDSGNITLAVENSGSTDLPAVQETNPDAPSTNTPTVSRTLTAGETSPLPVGIAPAQTTIQVFPAGASADAITLTLSLDGAGGVTSVVAQMLVGHSTS